MPVPWLLTAFIGGGIGAYIISSYSEIFNIFTTIIFFIPFVIGLLGNAEIKGATVILEGLVNGSVQSDNIKTLVLSEVWVGILNGLIFWDTLWSID